MKTITITIPDELDIEAANEAMRQGISKSELIRRGLAAVLTDRETPSEKDPWRELAGFADAGIRADPGEIDRVVYKA